jgi:hypothetical protein
MYPFAIVDHCGGDGNAESRVVALNGTRLTRRRCGMERGGEGASLPA